MKRIGLVLSQPPAYSETFFNSKIKGLKEQGFQPVLFVQRGRADFNLCPVKKSAGVYSNKLVQLLVMFSVYIGLLPYLKRVMHYVFIERQEGTSWASLFKKIYLNAHLLKADVDWLHFGFATQALGSETVAKAIGAKMAVSFRGFDINVYPLKHPGCYELIWKHVDKVHSISKYLLNRAFSLGLDKHINYEVIRPAVDISQLDAVKNNKVVQSNFINILTIARLHWIKGIDLLIETAVELKEKSVDFKWHVVGEGDSQSMERHQYHIYQKGLEDRVILDGKLSHEDTLKQLAQVDVYVQCSLNEGFCNAVLEAQASGKLCIATLGGGISENILDGKTGWVVERGNSESLADKIEEVIMLSADIKDEISKAAQARVKEEFNLKIQKEAFKRFYIEN